MLQGLYTALNIKTLHCSGGNCQIGPLFCTAQYFFHFHYSLMTTLTLFKLDERQKPKRAMADVLE